MKRIMRVDTQQFIRLLKQFNTLEETLKKMTYGYTDPDTGKFEVASYAITSNFFADFINCCDCPEGKFIELLHEMDSLEFRERVEEDKPSTWQEKMTKAMVAVLQMSRVRTDEGFCNGFSDSIDSDLYKEGN